MRRIRKFFLAVLIMALLAVIALTLLYPYLAVTAPVHASVAVVEGWIPADRMTAVRDELDRHRYTQVFTTGTLRPFSYHLRNGDQVTIHTSSPVQGDVRINVSGIAHAGFILLAGPDTVLVQPVNGAPTTWHTRIDRPVNTLTLLSTNGGTHPGDIANIYVKRFHIGGVNVHAQVQDMDVLHMDGSLSAGTPTHAHAAAAQLIALGIPESAITIAPAVDGGTSRTLANATGFSAMAQAQGVDRFDVISLGVHARRSRKMYRKAMGGTASVGVIAIEDPDVARDSWWKHRLGRYRMLKEVAGVPMSNFFDAAE